MNLNGMVKNDKKGTQRAVVLFNYFYCNPTPQNRNETYATECSTCTIIISILNNFHLFKLLQNTNSVIHIFFLTFVQSQ